MAALSVISTMLMFFCFHTLGYAIQCGKHHHDSHYTTRSLQTADSTGLINLPAKLHAPGSAMVFVMDASTGDVVTGLSDSTYKDRQGTPHISWNAPNTEIPEWSSKILRNLYEKLKTASKSTPFYYIIMDAHDVYVCLMEDIEEGDGFPRTFQSLGEKMGSYAGAYYGAIYGSSFGTSFGPFGTVAGGVLGAITGGFAGATVGEKAGEFLGKKTTSKQK